MANLTDPHVRALQGSDPQNLMEYITRQKIYDSRFWKEECFGLTTADVLEKAAKSIQCIGGTFGANQKPTKFLCLVLKLLQLQPDVDVILEDFVRQSHFKYVKVLGAFYLRLTGRPADIYQGLEPLYNEYSKIKLRKATDWELVHMDQLVHQMLSEPNFVGIALPRLPARETMEQEGYLEEGPRHTALNWKEHRSLKEYLRHRATVDNEPAFYSLWKRRFQKDMDDSPRSDLIEGATIKSLPLPRVDESLSIPVIVTNGKRSVAETQTKTKRKKRRKDNRYGTLFKKSGNMKTDLPPDNSPPIEEESSAEYWNEQRAKLGLKPLR